MDALYEVIERLEDSSMTHEEAIALVAMLLHEEAIGFLCCLGEITCRTDIRETAI